MNFEKTIGMENKNNQAENQRHQETLENEYEQYTVRRLADLLRQGASKGTIASCLSFYDAPETWALREEILELANQEGSERRDAIKSDLISGLAGLDSEEAWQWREKFAQEDVDLNGLALSLRGLDSEEAWQWREKILKELGGKDDRYRNSKTLFKSLFTSVIGLDSEKSWEFRDYLLGHGGAPADYVLSLVGVNSPKAQEKRSAHLGKAQLYEGQNLFNSLMISTVGQDDKFTHDLHLKFIKDKGDRNTLLDSLATDESKEASEARHKYHEIFKTSQDPYNRQELALHLALSIAGLHEQAAENIRQDLERQGYFNEVAYSLRGDTYSVYMVNEKSKN